MFLKLNWIVLDSGEILGSYAKNWFFHQNNIFQYYFSKSVHGSQTVRYVKLG